MKWAFEGELPPYERDGYAIAVALMYGYGIIPTCGKCGAALHGKWNPLVQRHDFFCPSCSGLTACPADHALYPRCPLCKGSGFVEAA